MLPGLAGAGLYMVYRLFELSAERKDPRNLATTEQMVIGQITISLPFAFVIFVFCAAAGALAWAAFTNLSRYPSRHD